MSNLYTLKSGNASDPTVWSGGVVPVSGDRVLINIGHEVTVDGAYTWGDDTTSTITINGAATYAGIYVRGTLKASRTVSTTLTCRGDLMIADYGSIDYGTELDPIPAGVHANIVLNYSTVMAHAKYGLNTRSSFKGFRFWGVDKTPRTAVMAVALAADTVVAVGEAVNWAVGDILCFGVTMTGNVTSVTYRAIAAIDGLDITLSGSLGADSHIGRTVLNLTRNVKLQGYLPLLWSSYASMTADTNPVWTDTVEIGPCEFNLQGGSNSVYRRGGLCLTWSYLYTGTDVIKRVYRPVVHDIYGVVGSTVTTLVNNASNTSMLHLYRNFGYQYEIEEPVISSQNKLIVIGAAGACVVTIKNAHVVKTERGPIATDMNAGLVIDGGHWEAVEWSMVYNNMIDVVYNNTTFNGIGWLFRSLQLCGSLVYNNCNLGGQRGFFNSPGMLYLENNNIVKVNYNNCTVHPSLLISRAVNLAAGNYASYYKFKNKNNDTTSQEIYRKGGKVSRDNTNVHRGRSSLQMASWYSTAPLTHTITAAVSASGSARLRGYARFNTVYGTATPPQITISGMGITPVIVVCPAVADTWHLLDVTVANPQTYSGEFSVEFSALSAANTETALAWFDGFSMPDFVDWTRLYGDIYNPGAATSKPNPLTLLTADQAAALSGLSFDAGVLTLTEPHTLREVYDWMQWYECDNRLDPILSSGDGLSFTLEADLVMAAELTGSLVTARTVVVTCPLTGNYTQTGGTVELTSPGTISGGFDSTELRFAVAGTYDISPSTFSGQITLSNTSGGSVIVTLALANINYVNTGPDTTVQQRDVRLTLTGLQIGSDVVVLRAGTNTVLAQADEVQGTTWEYAYATAQSVDIGVIKPGYEMLYVRNYALSGTDAPLPISQRVDRNYRS